MTSDSNSIETKSIHAGAYEPKVNKAVTLPIFQSSTFEYSDNESDYHDIKYLRLNNTPNHIVLHRRLAALENAEAALVTSSGMAAISTSLLALMKAGDHLLIQDCLYGGTHSFVAEDLVKTGVTFDFIDAQNPKSWEKKLKPQTKVIYVETISNPLLQIADLKAVIEFAKFNRLVSMIDNTFASPVNFRPAEWEFDLSLHSCTKYLNGHSDIVAGAVIGREALIKTITHKLNHLGGTLDPHSCFLLERGIKTLALRVRFQNESALKIAQFLSTHRAVSKVYYPGLEVHPQYRRAQELLNGFGGVLSFELKGGSDAAVSLIDRVKISTHAPSLGGVETLITRPGVTTHISIPPEERLKLGIRDDLIRLSVGIEATADLISDLDGAL